MPRKIGRKDSFGFCGRRPGCSSFVAAMDPSFCTKRSVPHGSMTGKGGLPKPGNLLERTLSPRPEERHCGREA